MASLFAWHTLTSCLPTLCLINSFGCLKDLSNLTQLSVKAEDPKVTLALLQALETACPLLTTLRLRSSVLSAACLPALAAIPGLRNLQVGPQTFTHRSAISRSSSVRDMVDEIVIS